ncbi:MAG: hypothetical protein B7Y70_12590 [Rhizobiales bacterium 35-68-8]|nr:MAG: hypothetical protein B7Y70_12590 [Rhizobiales bacterium 35-68-8]
MTTTFTLLDDALMARMSGGTQNPLVPFAPGPVILPHMGATEQGMAGAHAANGFPIGPCPNPDAHF